VLRSPSDAGASVSRYRAGATGLEWPPGKGRIVRDCLSATRSGKTRGRSPLHPQWAHFVERPFPTEEAQELLTSAAPESTPARIAAVSTVRVRSLLETLSRGKTHGEQCKAPEAVRTHVRARWAGRAFEPVLQPSRGLRIRNVTFPLSNARIMSCIT